MAASFAIQATVVHAGVLVENEMASFCVVPSRVRVLRVALLALAPRKATTTASTCDGLTLRIVTTSTACPSIPGTASSEATRSAKPRSAVGTCSLPTATWLESTIISGGARGATGATAGKDGAAGGGAPGGELDFSSRSQPAAMRMRAAIHDQAVGPGIC